MGKPMGIKRRARYGKPIRKGVQYVVRVPNQLATEICPAIAQKPVLLVEPVTTH
jgi:hypothetical protein